MGTLLGNPWSFQGPAFTRRQRSAPHFFPCSGEVRGCFCITARYALTSFLEFSSSAASAASRAIRIMYSGSAKKASCASSQSAELLSLARASALHVCLFSMPCARRLVALCSAFQALHVPQRHFRPVYAQEHPLPVIGHLAVTTSLLPSWLPVHGHGLGSHADTSAPSSYRSDHRAP